MLAIIIISAPGPHNMNSMMIQPDACPERFHPICTNRTVSVIIFQLLYAFSGSYLESKNVVSLLLSNLITPLHKTANNFVSRNPN